MDGNGHVWQLENEKGKFAVKTFINREFCLDYTLYEKMANLELQQILKQLRPLNIWIVLLIWMLI